MSIKNLLLLILTLKINSCGEKPGNISKEININLSSYKNILTSHFIEDNKKREINIDCLDFNYILSAYDQNKKPLFEPKAGTLITDMEELTKIVEKNQTDWKVSDILPVLKIKKEFTLEEIPEETSLHLEGYVKICYKDREIFGLFNAKKTWSQQDLKNNPNLELTSYFSLVFPFLLTKKIQESIKKKSPTMNEFIPVVFNHNIDCLGNVNPKNKNPNYIEIKTNWKSSTEDPKNFEKLAIPSLMLTS